MTHSGDVVLQDINDKYMISGSRDCPCIVWELPNFKAIGRLIFPYSDFIDMILEASIYTMIILYVIMVNILGFGNQVLILIIWNIN